LDIEIGYLPKKYYDSNPDAGGCFPFALEGSVPYVFNLDGFYLPECEEHFLPMWMKNIKGFPLYLCAEIPSYYKEDYEYTCNKFTIRYRNLTSNRHHFVSVAEFENEMQFREVFPFYISLGSGNDLVLWSTTKDVFSVEQRKWKGNWEGKVAEAVVVKVEADTSIFWIGYDGDNIAVISNQSFFSTYENIVRTLPEFVVPNLCEYE
jgi:hypothetical protein